MTLTNYRDDSVGGDTNGDGSTTSPSVGGVSIYVEGGATLSASHLTVSWAREAVRVPHSSNQRPTHVTLADGKLHDTNLGLVVSDPAAVLDVKRTAFSDNRSTAVTGSQVTATGCASASFVGNTFDGTRLSLDSCDATVAANVFNRTRGPLTVSRHPDLSKIDVAGTGSNVFVGQDAEVVAALGGAVPAGKTWILGNGVVYNPSGIDVRGTVQVDPGVVLKTDAGIQNRGGGFSVNGDGFLRLLGTAEAPITATSLRDDTVGGGGVQSPV